MKRIFAAAIACVLAFSVVGCTAKSKDVSGSVSQPKQSEEIQVPSTITYESLDDMPENSEEDFYFTETSNGMRIDSYGGASPVVIIPATIGGKPVVELRDSAFANSDVQAVVIPEGVKRIGEYAFQNCMDLQYVKMQEGLSSIGCAAFFGCTSLEKADIPEGVTCFEDYLFFDTQALKQVTIPASVTEMPGGITLQCPDLVIVTPAGSVAETVAKEEGLTVVNP